MTPELASLRLREISNLIVSLRANEKEYPANGYMIQRLAKERIIIMQRFIKAVPAAIKAVPFEVEDVCGGAGCHND